MTVSATLPASHAGAADDIVEMTVRARPIDAFRVGSDQSRFGELEFDGGLVLYGSSRHFGALSALHVYDDQRRFLGVTDTGFWYAGTIERDDNGRATGLTGVTMQPVADENGKSILGKWNSDAEGLTVDGDTAIVSFERAHRIARYRLAGNAAPALIEQYRPPVPLYELRDNKGFEAVAVAPAGTPLDGAVVGISEKSLDKARNIMAFVKPRRGASFEFSVARNGKFDITDAKFLPGGDLILLERRFNVQDGVAMRFRRIAVDMIEPGATVDGEVLLEADMLYQIDNMEGMSITTDPDGTPRLTIVSDDNHSILQRNLLLEFRLVGDREPSAQAG